jgi:carboxypeptidase PM20D1
MLYEITGNDHTLKPYLFAAHYDVVPATSQTSDSWSHTPFSGSLDADEAHVYGRGSLDDKSSMLGQLEAVQMYLRKHRQPERTLYLAYGHDEEISGHQGARLIVRHLEARGVALEYVIDEGTMIISDFISDLTRPIALIGVCDKGYLTLKFHVNTSGGHSSMPNREHSALSVIVEAASKYDLIIFYSVFCFSI